MIFGVGMGVGLLTWGIAEPIAGLENNPDLIRAMSATGSSENTSSALKWSYAHWGFAGWASYAIVGLAVGYTGHRQRLPLTIRTALLPLFGNSMKGWFGHLIEILTVVVTVFGVIQILGYALEESVMALAHISDVHWILDDEGNASVSSKIAASTFVFFLAAASAISGIGRGIKWFSNSNMLLSFIFLATILLASSFKEALLTLTVSVFDYLVHLPSMTFEVWRKDGTTVGDGLQAWQGTWSMYHWAGWWLSFSTMIWMSWAGGHAIALELSGLAKGELINSAVGLKIFALTQLMFEPASAWLVSMLLIFLIVTYLVTTIDSAIIVAASALSEENQGHGKSKTALIIALALALVMALLIYVDGFSPIRSAMVVASAPISALIVTLCLSIAIAIYRDPASK